jgi:hypothetical protein
MDVPIIACALCKRFTTSIELQLGNGAAIGTRMVARVFPAVRSEPAISKVGDAVKRGESSLWIFEVKRLV